jgi:hypothetical protein
MARTHAPERNEADYLPWQPEICEQARGDSAHDRDHTEQHGSVVRRQPRLRLRHLTILVRRLGNGVLADVDVQERGKLTVIGT